MVCTHKYIFNEQVEKYQLDKYTKKLKTLSFTKLFLYAHLNQMKSLYDLNTAQADKDLQKELGFKSISVSQLSRKNKSIQSFYRP